MHFEAYGATRPQEGRSGNEDAFAILRDGPLVAAGELVLLLTDGAWTPLAGSPYRLGRLVMEAALRHLSEVPPAILGAASRSGLADDMTAVLVRGRAAV